MTATTACAPTPASSTPTTTSESDRQAVLNTVKEMTAAFQAGDIDKVMASYADGATIVFEPGAPVSDPAQQRAAFQQFFAAKPEFTYAGHEVHLTGDTAVHLAPWTMTGTAPDGSAITDRGLSVAVLRRQADGRWLMVIDDPHGEHLMNEK